MNTRPKRSDSEQDVLEMQKIFLAEKAKQSQFQPAAQVVRIDKGIKPSLFSKTRQKSSDSDKSKPKSVSPTVVLLGDIVEKKATTIEQPPKLHPESTDFVAFPKVQKHDSTEKPTEGKSIFALSMERKRSQQTAANADTEPAPKTLKAHFGNSSAMVEDATTSKSIHEENLEVLSQMKKEEILAERANLLESLDPNLLRFIQEKRKQKNSKEVHKNPEEAKPECDDLESVPALQLLQESEAENWVHFNVVEKEKFEWMKDIPTQIAKLKPGATFEARFDWKGVLLPYAELDGNQDNRELYLHGEEPHRPGYTLQELFRLCRSSIIQQRVSAFGSISGILSIYNQGFYDNVLDLPITKIFFLLRFGFDENTPAILEIVSKALAMLFYNDTDEILLDIISETSEGYLQPVITDDQKDQSTDQSENIENAFSKMKLTSSPFTTNIEEDEADDKTSMSDFQMAETDLVECLLRTNIIQRMSYILGIMRPQNSTVFSCLKILIRIARSNKESCIQIVSNAELMNTLFECFLPKIESIGYQPENYFYNFPQYLVLKLFRIILSQHISLCIKLSSLGLEDCIKGYLYNRQDIRTNLIKVQIESLRILRSMMLINAGGNTYRELLPAFRYMLEWHYQHVVFDEGGPFLIRQHASALINAIYSGVVNEAVPILGEMLVMCSCKWFHEATSVGIKEFSQSALLSSCLNSAVCFMTINKSLYRDFIDKYLRKFLSSKTFLDFLSGLSYLSILLKTCIDRRHVHPPLLNLGSIVLNDVSPQLIVSQTYPAFFLGSLLKVLETLFSINDNALLNSIMQIEIADCLTDFLQKLSKHTNRKLATSILAKSEIKVVFKLLCFKPIREILTKETVLQAAYNLVCCLTSEHMIEIEILFKDILFSPEYLQFDQNLLLKWRKFFLDAFVFPNRIVIHTSDISLSMPCSKIAILPSDWPYLLLKTLLNKYLQQMSKTADSYSFDLPEDEIISTTLRFVELLEKNGLAIVSPTEKLMYLMISFMGPDSKFLEPDMKILLRETVRTFFSSCRDIKFQFNESFEGKSKFENLYVLFLDHFQAASYGDETFGSLVLVPLSQKYENKWRKMVWSEHASVLRFLNCDEKQLLGTMEDYLQPIEDDVSLVRSYARSLNSNLLRPKTIPYRIAEHHVKHFKLLKRQK